ncbi:hypothetical protein [uncultured Roseibium sp.]|jgi:hypothetical protein|uniref:hypothetical protein n=1 Tax=uncultured Roseibium sp. TaxID=1936171 RepID=UPI002615AC35|nr:hypothetical protein [uncultured Roseibium sp.]
MGNDLGFGGAAKANRKTLDLTGFEKPNPVAQIDDLEKRAEEHAAERAGFTSREPVERVVRQRKAKEPTDQVFVRAPISVINRYKTHCNETGLSYGELLDELMKRAGI